MERPRKLSPSSRLRDLWELHYLPQCIANPNSRAVEGYLRAIALWEELTPNRPLKKIRSEDLGWFKERLLQMTWRGKMISANTVRKHLEHIGWLLNQAGPKANYKSLKTAKGLVDDVPFTRLPPYKRSYRAEAKEEHVAALLAVVDAARFPQLEGVRPGDLWRALLLTMLSTSLRIGQCVALPSQAVDWPEQLLIAPAEICQKSKMDEPKPLHEAAVRALLHAKAHRRELLLPFFPRPHAKSTIYDELHRLQRIAGVPRFGFHAIRRHVITTLSIDSPAAAQLAAGHQDYKTTQGYQTVRLLRQAVDRMTIFDTIQSN
ncbi:tyrosine-type recombinase/integrase [Blastopirellula retiformator]|uniref:Phage integrase family protein n=1 Tax=Blastopirellula retiformator TaxID=2527970 RepID=A0A5C5VKY0_9BACT|nr:tyrosine-type recombinase/integrase [Blastopirellula retiformator]TWT38691.1 Phage integrase family protein [Blastopirellula retiformator]